MRILQLESDIKLKEMKLDLLKLQSESQLYDHQENIRQLQELITRVSGPHAL